MAGSTRSARLFLCARARCRDQVLLCSHCDHGQLYCSRACSFASRRERRRETAKRYQNSRIGQLKHAARTACWRQRQRSQRLASASGDIDKVTHQGCAGAPADASLLACQADPSSACELDSPSESTPNAEPAAAAPGPYVAPVCRHCGRSVLPHVRLTWLRGNGGRRRSHHDHPT
jgi:hypothetical protein